MDEIILEKYPGITRTIMGIPIKLRSAYSDPMSEVNKTARVILIPDQILEYTSPKKGVLVFESCNLEFNEDN